VHDPSRPRDGDGVIVRTLPSSARARVRTAGSVLAACAVIAGVGLVWQQSQLVRGEAPRVGSQAVPAARAASPASPLSRVADAGPPPRVVRRAPSASAAAAPAVDADFTAPSTDPDDIAAHIDPRDPEPTMAELITALRESGIDTGIAAFNPPGTVPFLHGLAVPPDFPLPPGYVRHHQVTDQGEDLEPILMFAPDAALFDADGQPIALPEDLVVPPEFAPPGLPLRPATLPDA